MITKLMIALMLVLMILAMYGKPSAVDYDGMRDKIDARSLKASVNGLAMAESNYQFQNNQDLPIATWKASLRKSGSRVPVNKGMPLSYGETGGVGRYFCFTLEYKTNRGMKILSDLHTELNDDGTFDAKINDFCGAAVDTVEPLTDLNTVALTIYTGK